MLEYYIVSMICDVDVVLIVCVFQDDKDFVYEFVNFDGLSVLILVG